MKLRETFERFDLKNTEPLEAIAKAYRPTDHQLMGVLFEVLDKGDANARAGVSWVLKYYADHKHCYDGEEVELMTQALLEEYLEDEIWHTRLHLLQILIGCVIPKKLAKRFFSCLKETVLGEDAHSNKFVRAWAYGCLQSLAYQYETYRDEVRGILDRAYEHESAAVKARIRNSRKAYGF